MKHLNEQTQGMADSISEASHRPGIQWTRVTWYSWSLAIIVFLLILPGVTFYIGTQYQAVKDEERSLEMERSAFAVYPHVLKHIRGTTACALDAKECKDGTSVSRIFPNCEFALCPDGLEQSNREATLLPQ